MRGSNKQGVTTWNNNQGVATLRSNNTHENKPKVTKKKKITYKLQIETTNLAKQSKKKQRLEKKKKHKTTKKIKKNL